MVRCGPGSGHDRRRHDEVSAALPVVLAGFTAFLSLYATQPMLPAVPGRIRRQPFRRQPHGDRDDGGGGARGAVRRAARRCVGQAARHRGRGVRARGGDTARIDGRDAQPDHLLALRPGPRDTWRLRGDGRVRPRSLASVAGGHGDGRLRQRHGHRRFRRPRHGRRRRGGRGLARELPGHWGNEPGVRGDALGGAPRRGRSESAAAPAGPGATRWPRI